MKFEHKRLSNIDVFKAIGLLLVIIGHIGIGGDVGTIFRASFQMPMFFFISGYLFKEAYNAFDFLKRKAKSLLNPYIIYGIINLIFCAIVLPHFNLSKYLCKFLWINNTPPIPITGALWFLTCLFFVNIFYYLLNKYLKKYTLEIVIILLVALEAIFQLKLPYSIDTAIYMLPIFYAGVKFKQIEPIFNDKIGLLLSFIFLITTFFTIFYNGHVNPRKNIYANIFLFYFNAIAMSYAFYYFSKFIEKIKWINKISFIGRYSLEFMCTHQMLLKFLKMNNITDYWVLLFLTIFIITVGLNTYNYIKQKITMTKEQKCK